MSTVVNLRGTGGSGKSTVVRRVMERYRGSSAEVVPERAEGRKQPTGYRVDYASGGALYVPGHYETACGGCDTIKTVDEVYALVSRAVSAGWDVLYEGIMVQDDVRRAVELDKRLRRCATCGGSGFAGAGTGYGDVCSNCVNGEVPGLHVILLSTPVEECLAAIRARRAVAGNEKPLSEKNTRERAKRQEGIRGRLRDAGVSVERLDREAAYLRVCALLRLSPGASSGA